MKLKAEMMIQERSTSIGKFDSMRRNWDESNNLIQIRAKCLGIIHNLSMKEEQTRLVGCRCRQEEIMKGAIMIEITSRWITLMPGRFP